MNSTNGLRDNLLNVCIRTVQRCNQSSSFIHDGAFDIIVSNVTLKTSSIFAKTLILGGKLGPARASAD